MMLEFNIPKTEKETYTTFPSFMLTRVEPWLERNAVRYNVYTGSNIPDKLPHGYEFKGHKSRRSVACVAANLDSEALHAAIERMIDIDPKDI